MEWPQCLAVASAMLAFAGTRWRSRARYTVERPTPKSSATSRVLYSPLCTSETRCASCFRLSLGCLPRSRPLAFATFMPSTVRSRIRSDSNSATMARTLKQQPADGVGGVVDRAAQAQAGLPGGELVGDRSGVGQGSGETVEPGDHQGVTGPARGECLAEPGTFAVGARQAAVNVDPAGLDSEAEEGVALGGEVLLIGGASGVPDKQCAHGATPRRLAQPHRTTRPARASGRARLLSTRLLRCAALQRRWS